MRILLAKKNTHLCQQIVNLLSHAGYDVEQSHNGTQALQLGLEQHYDAIILGLDLDELDGLSILSLWKEAKKDTPIIVLVENNNTHQQYVSLNTGADDYLAKPFNAAEILPRLRNLVHQVTGFKDHVLKYGAVSVDLRSQIASVSHGILELTKYEFRLLNYLIHHPEKLIHRKELANHLYENSEDISSNTIEVFIGRLRKKLPPNTIQTIRGLGYKLTAPYKFANN